MNNNPTCIDLHERDSLYKTLDWLTPELETAEAAITLPQEISPVTKWSINLFRIERKIGSVALRLTGRLVLAILSPAKVEKKRKCSCAGSVRATAAGKVLGDVGTHWGLLLEPRKCPVERGEGYWTHVDAGARILRRMHARAGVRSLKEATTMLNSA